LARLAHGEFFAGLQHDPAGIGVDEIVDRLVAAETVGIERHAPTVLLPLVTHLAVEGVEDFLSIHAERIEQRCHRDLPAPINARIDDVLGVEFDVEPGASIGNDPRGEQQFAR
jgi:hypothetical protein